MTTVDIMNKEMTKLHILLIKFGGIFHPQKKNFGGIFQCSPSSFKILIFFLHGWHCLQSGPSVLSNCTELRHSKTGQIFNIAAFLINVALGMSMAVFFKTWL